MYYFSQVFHKFYCQDDKCSHTPTHRLVGGGNSPVLDDSIDTLRRTYTWHMDKLAAAAQKQTALFSETGRVTAQTDRAGRREA